MRFDNIVIGGGLSGMLAGITLACRGSKVALISSGKSALHFFSGSLELWHEGAISLERFLRENPSHPYSKIIEDGSIERYTSVVKDIFARIGITLQGEGRENHWRITPLGALKPTWLTAKEYFTFDYAGECRYHNVALVGIEGYLDFQPEFIADSLKRRGIDTHRYTVGLPTSPQSERRDMHTLQLSHALRGEILIEFAHNIANVIEDEEIVLLPALFELGGDNNAIATIESVVGRRVMMVPTLSVSAVGVGIHKLLIEEFKRVGGVFLGNDNVAKCSIENESVRCIYTSNNPEEELVAEHYILATGSFFGGGLVATNEDIYEPIAGVDIVAPALRREWYGDNIIGEQPFERFGVATDKSLHPLLYGTPIHNLYAIGGLLAGADAVKEGCGGGIAAMSALRVVDDIFNTH